MTWIDASVEVLNSSLHIFVWELKGKSARKISSTVIKTSQKIYQFRIKSVSYIVREEVLHITLATLNLKDLLRNWRVSSDPSLSDHRLIVFSLEMENTEEKF